MFYSRTMYSDGYHGNRVDWDWMLKYDSPLYLVGFACKRDECPVVHTAALHARGGPVDDSSRANDMIPAGVRHVPDLSDGSLFVDLGGIRGP